MEKQVIFEKVKVILNEEGYDGVELKSNLKEDLELDSLDVVVMSMGIEKEFNISIPDDITGNVETVEDIVSYLVQIIK